MVIFFPDGLFIAYVKSISCQGRMGHRYYFEIRLKLLSQTSLEAVARVATFERALAAI